MTTYIYRSTDTGITSNGLGLINGITTVMDACLIDGYNSGSVTSITRTGNIATVTRTNHGFRDYDVVSHSGSNQAEYNVEAKITVVTSDTYTFEVSGTPVSPATGTLISKKAPLGWTKAFSSGAQVVYKQPSPANGHYLWLNDAAATNIRCRGYETAYSYNDDGVNPFPTNTQLNGGCYFFKSATADATARQWYLVSNGKIIYFFSNQANAADWSTATGFIFGKINSLRSGDQYDTVLIAGSSSTVATNYIGILASALATASNAHYICRAYTGVASAVTLGKHSDYVKSVASTIMGINGPAFPHGPDGALLLSPVWLHEPANSIIRGTLPGVWNILHNKPYLIGDIIVGSGDFSGKVLQVFPFTSGGSIGHGLIEISNGW